MSGAGGGSQRALDLVAATLGLIGLAPVLVLLAAVVRWDVGRPVIFAQPRPGLGGRRFTLYKFRTMRAARDPARALDDDAERLTRVGAFLRASSLDELPELWNVLRGDMSLVGPRPLLEEYLALYTPEQARRHEVRPGITGWAQVHGRNDMTWEDKFRLDVWYVDNRSLRLDLAILARTIGMVLSRRGVSRAGHATTERFRGTDDRAPR